MVKMECDCDDCRQDGDDWELSRLDEDVLMLLD